MILAALILQHIVEPIHTPRTVAYTVKLSAVVFFGVLRSEIIMF